MRSFRRPARSGEAVSRMQSAKESPINRRSLKSLPSGKKARDPASLRGFAARQPQIDAFFAPIVIPLLYLAMTASIRIRDLSCKTSSSG